MRTISRNLRNCRHYSSSKQKNEFASLSFSPAAHGPARRDGAAVEAIGEPAAVEAQRDQGDDEAAAILARRILGWFLDWIANV